MTSIKSTSAVMDRQIPSSGLANPPPPPHIPIFQHHGKYAQNNYILEMCFI